MVKKEEKYIEKKYVESIVYDKELLEKVKCKEILINEELLEKLKRYLEIKKNNQTIDSKIQTRIYEVINYIRFDMGKYKNSEFNELINGTIILLNECEDTRFLEYLYNQANARANDSIKTSISEKMDRLHGLYDDLCKSIKYDYQVLCDIYKEPGEYDRVIQKYINNGWFLNSIKGIYYENPNVFNDTVKENLENTIIENEKIIPEESKMIGIQEIRSKILRR
jgi:hypothetical protein